MPKSMLLAIPAAVLLVSAATLAQDNKSNLEKLGQVKTPARLQNIPTIPQGGTKRCGPEKEFGKDQAAARFPCGLYALVPDACDMSVRPASIIVEHMRPCEAQVYAVTDRSKWRPSPKK